MFSCNFYIGGTWVPRETLGVVPCWDYSTAAAWLFSEDSEVVATLLWAAAKQNEEYPTAALCHIHKYTSIQPDGPKTCLKSRDNLTTERTHMFMPLDRKPFRKTHVFEYRDCEVGWVGVGWGGMLTFLVLHTWYIAMLLRSLGSFTTLHVATLLRPLGSFTTWHAATLLRSLGSFTTWHVATLLRSLGSFTTLHVATLLRSLGSFTTLHVATLLRSLGSFTTLHVATLLRSLGSFTTWHVATLLRSLGSFTTLHVATLLRSLGSFTTWPWHVATLLRSLGSFTTWHVATLLRSLGSFTTWHAATLLRSLGSFTTWHAATLLRSLGSFTTWHVATLLRSLGSFTTLHVATLLRSLGSFTTWHVATLLRSLGSFTTLHVATLLRSLGSFTTLHVATLLRSLGSFTILRGSNGVLCATFCFLTTSHVVCSRTLLFVMGKFSANWHSYLAISCNASACHGQQLPCAHEVWTSRCRGSKGHQQWKLLRCHMWQSSVGYGETRHAASSAASSLSAEKVFLPFYAGEIASAICRADAQTLAHSVFCPMSISFLKLPPPACPAIYYLYCIHLNTYKAHTHTPPTHTP